MLENCNLANQRDDKAPQPGLRAPLGQPQTRTGYKSPHPRPLLAQGAGCEVHRFSRTPGQGTHGQSHPGPSPTRRGKGQDCQDLRGSDQAKRKPVQPANLGPPKTNTSIREFQFKHPKQHFHPVKANRNALKTN